MDDNRFKNEQLMLKHKNNKTKFKLWINIDISINNINFIDTFMKKYNR